MIGGSGMKKDVIRFAEPQECSICRRTFSTPNALIAHFESFHSNRLFSNFSSFPGASPTTFRPNPNLNRNSYSASPARNHFDLNYYRTGYLDEQGRFHKRNPAQKTNFLFGQQQKPKPKLMDLFPATSSEGDQTLPLLRQLEQRRLEDNVTRNNGAFSRSVDLTLRL